MNLHNFYPMNHGIKGVGSLQRVPKSNPDGKGFFTVGKKGDIVEGLISRVSDSISVDFSGKEISVPKQSIKNAVQGETRKFEILDVSREKLILRDISDLSGEARPILCTQVRGMDSFAQRFEQGSLLSLKQQSEEAEQTLKQIKNSLDKDVYGELSREAIDFSKLSPKDLALAIQQIRKEKLEQRDQLEKKKEEKAAYQDELFKAGLKAAVSSGLLDERLAGNADAKKILEILSEYHLPMTTENVSEAKNASDMAGNIQKMTENYVYHLLYAGSNVTPRTVFEAAHTKTGNLTDWKKAESFSKESGYQAEEAGKETEQEIFKQLKPQVLELLKASKIDEEEGMGHAEWLFSKKLPITPENIRILSGMEELRENYSEDSVLNEIVRNMARGEKAENTNLLLNEKKVNSSIKQFLQQFEESDKIYDRTGKEYNRSDAEAISEHLKLEELRLKMTTEAGYRLMNKGIILDTSNLQRIVKELEEQEREYSEGFFSGKKEDAAHQSILLEPKREDSSDGAMLGEVSRQQNGMLLKETMDVLSFVKKAPAEILGETLKTRYQTTLLELSDRAKQKESAFSAYETMMTVPKKELGDSIQKAFQGMDDILAGLGLSKTEANERAVRILGYNQMAVTTENIEQMKHYDAMVNSLFDNMTPQTTVYMIREGINPLNTPIYELNDKLLQIRKEQGFSSEEKYSEFLWKLEREDGISEEERKSYMGLYRLINQVQKTDGAVIGMLANEGKEITLSSLLEAVRTKKSGGIDIKADERVGELESITWENETITEQLSGFYTGSDKEKQEASSGQRESRQEQQKYQEHLADTLLDTMTPKALKTVLHGSRDLLDQKLDLSLEQFYEEIRDAKGGETQEDQEYDILRATELSQELEAANQEELYFLNAFRQPASLSNVLSYALLEGKGRRYYEELLKDVNEKEKAASLSGEAVEEMDEPEKFEGVYGELQDLSENMLKDQYNEKLSDPEADLKAVRLDMKQLQRMTFGTSLLRNLALKNNYTIPLIVGDRITTMNVSILPGKEEGGKVQIRMDSEQLGSVFADFSIKDQELNGTILGDQEEGVKKLEEQKEWFCEKAEIMKLEVNNLSYGTDKNNSRIVTQLQDGKADTRDLYRVAKIFVSMVRTLEEQKR